jgi:hypothetical protein
MIMAMMEMRQHAVPLDYESVSIESTGLNNWTQLFFAFD